jgi:large subunit ribosomal protein L19e
MTGTQKRIASSILKCGESRVWIDPRSEKVKHAITRKDIRGFIKEGIIQKIPEKKANSHVSGRQQRTGSKKGTSKARDGPKANWLKIIRPQRKMLMDMYDNKTLADKAYRKMYKMIKGGAFRSRAHLMLHLKNKGLVKEEKK